MRIFSAVFLSLLSIGCSTQQPPKPLPPTSTSTASYTPNPHPLNVPSPEKLDSTRDIVADEKAKYLRAAISYMDNLFNADKLMVQQMDAASKGVGNLDELVGSISNAAKTEKTGFELLQNPPAPYRSMHSKLIQVHNGHVAAYLEYLKGLSTLLTPHKPGQGLKHVDKGHDILIKSVQLLNDTRALTP